MSDVGDLLLFIKKAEKLKVETRHSWLSNSDRQESVAEHSWMLALIAMSVFDSIAIEVDQLRVLKMLILHDLAEAITGDIPTFEKSKRQERKQENELRAMESITSSLGSAVAAEFMDIWQEYEENKTPEARLAQAIDKSEVWIQHVIADISTWDEGDFQVGIYNKDEYADFDPYMRKFKDEITRLFWDKLKQAGMVESAKPEEIEKAKKDKMI